MAAHNRSGFSITQVLDMLDMDDDDSDELSEDEFEGYIECMEDTTFDTMDDGLLVDDGLAVVDVLAMDDRL